MADAPVQINVQTNAEQEVWRVLNFIKGYYQDHLWHKRVTAYKNYFMYKIDRGLKIKDFQTNIKSPIVKMYVDAMWTGIYDNVISLTVIWRDPDDQKKSDTVKGFLEWGFSISNSSKELMQIVKESLITGAGYGKVGFVNNVKTIKYKKNFKDKSVEMKEQYPYLKYSSIFNIFHDPTVESPEDSPYFLERKIMDRRSVKKFYSWLIKNIEWVMAKAEANPKYFSNQDYNKIKHSLFWSTDTIKTMIAEYDNDIDIFTKNYLSVDYRDEFFEIIEYWEDDRRIILINGNEAYDWVNPLPIDKKPYVSIQYNKAPGLCFGNGLGTSLEDIQSMSDELLNLQMDNTKFQIAPMYQKLKGSDMFSQDKWALEYAPFKVIETNTPDWLQRLELWSPEFTGINMIQFLLQLWEMSEGVNSYSLWYQNKVERSATWVSALVQAFKARLLPLVESMNKALATIAEMWLATSIILMDDSFILRVIGKDGKVVFNEISVEELIGKFDIEFDAQALKSASREVRRNQLIQLVGMASQTGVDPNTQQYFLDMRKLWGEILDAFELPQELVMSSKEVVKDQSKVQIQQAKAQEKVQQATAPQWWMMPWAPWAPGVPGWEAGWAPWQPSVSVPWDTRTADIRANVPALSQEITPEPGLQQEWRALKDALWF